MKLGVWSFSIAAATPSRYRPAAVKIVVIEDFQLIRDMLAESCRNLVAGAQVHGAATFAEGLAACRVHQPDVVFLDLVLPDGDGLDLVPQITAISAQTRIIALTSHADEFTLHRAMQARVHGFVDKNEAPLDVLAQAIRTVMAGERFYSRSALELRAAMRADPSAFDKTLSGHEQHLLTLFGEGLTNEEIAARVGLAPKTVKWHRRNVMAKINVHSTPQLIHYALEKGFTRLRRAPLDASKPAGA
jgi:DNA-binding NarL/FixJ family response regulator